MKYFITTFIIEVPWEMLGECKSLRKKQKNDDWLWNIVLFRHVPVGLEKNNFNKNCLAHVGLYYVRKSALWVFVFILRLLKEAHTDQKIGRSGWNSALLDAVPVTLDKNHFSKKCAPYIRPKHMK